MSQALTQFQAHLDRADLADGTRKVRADDLARFVPWFEQTTGKTFDPVLVTSLDLKEYLGYLQSVQDHKPNTRNRVLSSLRVFFDWAEEQQLVDSNPARKVKPAKQQPSPPRWLDRPEQKRLRNSLEEEIQLAAAKAKKANDERLARKVRSLRDAAAIALMLDAGLRVAEVCDLQIRQVTINDRSGNATVIGKGNKRRDVALNPGARKAIEAWLAVRPIAESDLLLLGRGGKPLRPRGLQRRIEYYAQRAGLEDVTPHTLRHTFAKNLVDSGTPLGVVATLLGHSRLDTTLIYTKPGQHDLQTAVNSVDWGLEKPAAEIEIQETVKEGNNNGDETT